jgi:cytochrome bd-type quinol oxidase subunit 2
MLKILSICCIVLCCIVIAYVIYIYMEIRGDYKGINKEKHKKHPY